MEVAFARCALCELLVAVGVLQDITVGVTISPETVTGLRLTPVCTSHALFGGGQQEELRLFVHLWRLIMTAVAENDPVPDDDPLAQVLVTLGVRLPTVPFRCSAGCLS